MPITKLMLSAMFSAAAEKLLAEVDHLSEIDSRFGDGDHGVTMKKIALTINDAVRQWETQGIKEWVDQLGTVIMGIGGGSAGPLWGTLICGLALPLPPQTQTLEAPMLKEMLRSALDEMESISTARVGDKTMMDVLIPAVHAALAAQDDLHDILHQAALAAEQGARNTENFAAKFGRAKNYKEQTIGTPDAGAVSLMTFFLGLESGAK